MKEIHEMNDHTLVQEAVATYLANGLEGAERESFEAHVAQCDECSDVLDETRVLDRELLALFAPVRPAGMLEDRTIRSMRAEITRERIGRSWAKRIGFGIAASVGIGLTGAMMMKYVGLENLPFPGSWTERDQMTAQNDISKLDMGVVAFGDVENLLGKRIAGESDGARMLAENMKADDKPAEGTQTWDRVSGGDKSTQWFDVSGVTDGRSSGKEQEFRFGINTYSFQRSDQSVPLITNDRLYENGGPTRQSDVRRPSDNFYAESAPTDGVNAMNAPPLSSLNYTNDYAALGVKVPAFNPAKHYGLEQEKLQKSLDDTKLAIQDGESREKSGGKKLADIDAKKAENPASSDDKPSSGSKFGTEGFLKQNVLSFSSSGTSQTPPTNTGAKEPATPRKIIIRTGTIDFEIDSFDAAVANVTKLVEGIPNSFIATINSEKLPNGKVKGSVVLRVPPDHLDKLVLDLRRDLGKTGELKGQRIGSQDITKAYTDLESRLRAAKTMEQRLLQIIKDGKGEIKQLLEAEKELGVWRTRIEEFEGELRYYGNQVSLSTLTIDLVEKELRAAIDLVECERVQMGIEVEQVDKAQQQLISMVRESKGRVSKSELKQMSAGQYNAILHFEVPPDAAGPFRDRLHQLGYVARLEIDRIQQAEGGKQVLPDAKLKRGDAQFQIQLYNIANVAARETATLQLAATDVPVAYRSLESAVQKVKGTIKNATINEQDRQNITAQIDFEVRRADEAALQAALQQAGEVITRVVARAAQSEGMTDSKVLYRTSLISADRIAPRETTNLGVEVNDVDATVAVFNAQVSEVKGRVLDVQINRERSGSVSARLFYDVPLNTASGLVEKFKSAGMVRVHKTSRDPRAPEGKFALARVEVIVASADRIIPKDDGVWPQVRKGLSYSLNLLLWSLTVIVVGLCVVLPWFIIGYGAYRLLRRLFRRPATPIAPAEGTV